MSSLIVYHEVKDGENWANAWKKGPNSRHELFAKYGVKARTFRDPANPNFACVLCEVSDMKKFNDVMQSDLGKKAMAEDGLKIETVKILHEFTP